MSCVDKACFHAARFLQRPLAKLISTLRAPKSSEGYKAIGGGSPLRRITEEQADALAQSLKGRGLDAKVYVGMRYWTPFIDDAMEQVMLVLLDCDACPTLQSVGPKCGSQLYHSLWCLWRMSLQRSAGSM